MLNVHGCDVCDVTFPEKEDFDAHFEKFHAAEELFSCNICSDKFPKNFYLDFHNFKFHEEENPFICDECKCGFAEERCFRNHVCMIPCSICDEIFEGKKSLDVHIATVHEGKKIAEEFDTSSYDSDGNISSEPEKEDFEAHFERFQADEELFSCDICYDKFPKKFDLDFHNGKFHEEKNPFICDECKCGFAKENYFRNHTCMISCSICNKIFEGKKSLDTHMATFHEGKELFQCYQCDENFTEKSLLNYHLVHVHDCKFQCEICDMYHSTKDTLTRHIGKVHMGKKSFHCPKCDKYFLEKSLLNEHIESFHKKSFQCEFCGYSCSRENRFKIHVERVHEGKRPYVCELCGVSYKFHSGFVDHKRKKHEDKTEKPFKCDICSNTFGRACHLGNHIAKVHEKKKYSYRMQNAKRKNNSSIQVNEPNQGEKFDSKLLKQSSFDAKIQTVYNENTSQTVQVEDDTADDRFSKTDQQKKQQFDTRSEFEALLEEDLSNCKPDVKEDPKEKCLKRKQSEVKKSHNKSKKLKLHHSYYNNGDIVESCKVSEKNLNHEEENIVYECSICQAIYKSREEFNKHIATVHDREKQTLVCDICRNIYQTKEGLKHHISSAHEGIKYQCDICGISLKSKEGLKSHILNLHIEKRLYQCRQCSEKFLEKALLNEHVESFHKKSFQCEFCGYSCSEKGKFRVHVERVHEGKRPYVCELCGVSYKFQSSFVDHKRKKHEDKTEKQFKCDICSTTFGRACHLANHIAKVHEKKEYSYSMQYAKRKDNSSVQAIEQPKQLENSDSKLLKVSFFDT